MNKHLTVLRSLSLFNFRKFQQLCRIVNIRENSCLTVKKKKARLRPSPFQSGVKQAAVAKSEEGRRNEKQTLNRGMFACARYGAVNSGGRRPDLSDSQSCGQY